MCFPTEDNQRNKRRITSSGTVTAAGAATTIISSSTDTTAPMDCPPRPSPLSRSTSSSSSDSGCHSIINATTTTTNDKMGIKRLVPSISEDVVEASCILHDLTNCVSNNNNNSNNYNSNKRQKNQKKDVQFSTNEPELIPIRLMSNLTDSECIRLYRHDIWYMRYEYDILIQERCNTVKVYRQLHHMIKNNEFKYQNYVYCLRGFENYLTSENHEVYSIQRNAYKQIVFQHQQVQRNEVIVIEADEPHIHNDKDVDILIHHVDDVDDNNKTKNCILRDKLTHISEYDLQQAQQAGKLDEIVATMIHMESRSYDLQHHENRLAIASTLASIADSTPAILLPPHRRRMSGPPIIPSKRFQEYSMNRFNMMNWKPYPNNHTNSFSSIDDAFMAPRWGSLPASPPPSSPPPPSSSSSSSSSSSPPSSCNVRSMKNTVDDMKILNAKLLRQQQEKKKQPTNQQKQQPVVIVPDRIDRMKMFNADILFRQQEEKKQYQQQQKNVVVSPSSSSSSLPSRRYPQPAYNSSNNNNKNSTEYCIKMMNAVLLQNATNRKQQQQRQKKNQGHTSRRSSV